jgi:aminopeptidase N
MRRNRLLVFTALSALLLAAAAPAGAAPSKTAPSKIAPSKIMGPAIEQTLPGRLPAEAVPLHYDITVTPDPARLRFEAEASIAFQARRPLSTLTLNAADLAFGTVTLDGKPVAPPVLDAKGETAVFTFARPLKAGRHVLRTAYTGKINQQAFGLFALDYDAADGQKKRALFTQFENSDARRFVPSWDEPGRKATFTLTVRAPEDQMVVSNQPVARERVVRGRQCLRDVGCNYREVTFARTPKMSSYLLFLAVGDLERTTAKADGVEIGVVAQRGSGAKGRLALESAGPLLHYFNDYFGTPYPLAKLDMIAGPGQSQFFGAMENWGAIFYFERALLVDPKLTTEGQRQGVYRVVAHEMAHQWFGDLVTMSWWDDLWLNEGFASWMQSKATQKFHPEWRPELAAISGRETAMAVDARSSSHPVVQKIENVAQASQAFDRITYAKGQAVIRMVESYVGEDAFRAGVRAYMKRHAYGNTVSDDLWAEVEKASGKPIRDIAHDFTLQTGIPLIRVASAACVGDETEVRLTQDRFGVDAPSKVPTTWRVPVKVKGTGSAETVGVIVRGPEGAVARVAGCGPLIANAGQTGYFRVLYSSDQLRALGGRFAALEAADQLGLLTDAWKLGEAGYAPVADWLDLSLEAPAEADPLVWSQVIETYGAIDGLLTGPARERWRAFVRKTLSPLMARVGWEPKPGESDNTALLREDLIGALAQAQDPAVLAEARRRFDLWLADPSSLSAALRGPVLGTMAGTADAATWERIRQRAASSRSALEKRDLYDRLGDARDPALAAKALALAISDEPPATSGPSMISRVGDRHPALALDFVEAHREAVMGRIESSSQTRYVPRLVQGSADPAMIGRLQAYAEKNIPADARGAVDNATAAIRFRSELKSRRGPEVERWLAQRGY